MVISIGVVAFHEHEEAAKATAAAEAVTQTSQAAIADLKQQILTRSQTAQQATIPIVIQQRKVRTPVEAIKAIPDVSSLPVTMYPLAGTSDYVLPAIDVVPLYQLLADGKRCGIDLAACTANYVDQQKINAQQALEIATWKKAAKGTFWKRTWDIIKVAAPVGAISYAIGRAQR